MNYLDIEQRRYIGSKSKLEDWIFSLIKKECNGGDVFVDIFAGTGVIGAGALNTFQHIVLNDLLYSNHVCYQAFFGKGKYSKKKLEKITDEYNKINPTNLKENYFNPRKN